MKYGVLAAFLFAVALTFLIVKPVLAQSVAQCINDCRRAGNAGVSMCIENCQKKK